MNCPKCGGAMWDNRESKRSPKQPDYKCKNRQCDNAIWLDKKDSAPASNGNGAGPSHAAPGVQRPLGPLYAECLDFAKKACAHYLGTAEPSDVIAAAATIFIQAARDGSPIRAPKAAPAAPPPPPPAPVYEPSDELPF